MVTSLLSYIFVLINQNNMVTINNEIKEILLEHVQLLSKDKFKSLIDTFNQNNEFLTNKEIFFLGYIIGIVITSEIERTIYGGTILNQLSEIVNNLYL